VVEAENCCNLGVTEPHLIAHDFHNHLPDMYPLSGAVLVGYKRRVHIVELGTSRHHVLGRFGFFRYAWDKVHVLKLHPTKAGCLVYQGGVKFV
jgi:hypothetical protein